jgi:heptosyltransferase-3
MRPPAATPATDTVKPAADANDRLCGMVSAHRREHGARTLVIFPGALGDLICAAPAIRALAGRYPDARVELMARAELAHFAAGRIAGIARGHSIDCREMSAMFRRGGERDERARKFFGAFDTIHSFFASGDAQFRATLGAAASAARISFHSFLPDSSGHVAAAYLRSVGALCDDLDASITLLDPDLEAARQVLERAGLEPAHYVIILPGSGSSAKNWPPEWFIELAKSVRTPMRPLVVLGPAEDAIAHLFAQAGLAVARDLRLETVAALARMAAAFAGNDSGVSHLAAAAGARGIVIFGPTDPVRWRPLGSVTVISSSPLGELAAQPVIAELRLILDESRNRA